MRPVALPSSAYQSQAGSPVCAEIEEALLRFSDRNPYQPHGLILGLDKYRQLKTQQPTRASYYAGIALVVDGSEPNRISVF